MAHNIEVRNGRASIAYAGEGAYNAVTEFVDHQRVDKDLSYIVHGRGAEIKQRAFQVGEAVMGGLLDRPAKVGRAASGAGEFERLINK